MNGYWLNVLGCLLLLGQASDWPGHTPPDEWNEPRVYHTAFDESRRDARLQFRRVESGDMPEVKILSPNRAYWFAQDPSEPPHGGTVEYTYTIFIERDYRLELSLPDCDSRYGPRAEWINQKLLYIEVWWGRIAGMSMVLDVEAEEIIFLEELHYGAIAFQQWQANAAER